MKQLRWVGTSILCFGMVLFQFAAILCAFLAAFCLIGSTPAYFVGNFSRGGELALASIAWLVAALFLQLNVFISHALANSLRPTS
jgi:hypothetical protein